MSDHYTYRVRWSAEDGEYVGTCAEFRSLSHLAPSMERALQGITKLVAETVAHLQASEEEVPEPLADRKFSGVFQTRIPPDLHRLLTLEAAESGVSLNRLVSYKLALPRLSARVGGVGKTARGL